MADERLRLTAEVTDGFSGPLGKLETALNRAARTGSQAGKDLKRDFEGFHGVLGKTTTSLQSMTAPLAALGVAGLGVGLSLTTMGSALRSFSSGTQQLSILSKETGLAVDQLRAFGSLGERFGVSAETMQGGARKFSEEMSRLRKRYGETYSSLQAMNLGDLVEKLVAAPNMKAALDAAMDTLSNIGDPVKRRKVAEQLFGGDQIGAIAGQLPGRVSEVLAEIEQRQGRTTDAQVKAAQRFEQTLSQLRESMDGLRTGALTPLLEAFNTFLATLNSPEALKVIKGEIEGLKTLIANTVAEFNKLDKLGDSLKGGKFDLKGNTDRELATIARVFEALKNSLGLGGPTVQQQSFGGGGFGGATIQRAGYGGPLSSMGGGYGSGGALRGGGGPLQPSADPNVTGGGAGRGYGGGGEPSASSGGASAPRGSGVAGGRAPARTSEMMAYAMDQLRREGVPEANLRQAAAHLVGQATAESGLNPNAVHDGGTGYGIYGARDPSPGRGRKTNMLNWLAENGYARNSAEGQMREMAHRAMSGQYGRTRRILMGQGSGDLALDTKMITGEFESPKVNDYLYRTGKVRGAYGAGASAVAGEGGGETPWYGRPRSNAPGQMSRLRDDEIEMAGSGGRAGDKLMRRLYGDEAPVARGGMGGGKGSLDITLHGFPAGTKPRASMDDLFKEVNVSKNRQVETTSL